MTDLVLVSVAKAFGATPVLEDVDLSVAAGEMMVLLGPSGGGKTTLLRLVAGVDAPDRGEIRLGGRVVAGPGVWVPPEKRRLGLVFQDGALFDHLSVAHNVGFGLPRGERRASPRIDELLDLVGLAGFGDRGPDGLSGGQRQRVALARALAPRPEVLLLDEPFSNLDAELRVRMRDEVRGLLGELGVTSVFVTHDQSEALALGDRVAVLHEGRVAQVAAPEELYRRPADRWVAGFVGSGSFVAGRSDGRRARTALGDLELFGDGAAGAGAVGAGAVGDVEVLVRPEEVRLVDGGDGGGRAVEGRVVDVRFEGSTVRSRVAVGGVVVEAVELGPGARPVGERVAVELIGPFPAYPTAPTVSPGGSPSNHDG